MDINSLISERVLAIIKHNQIKRDMLASLINQDKFKLDNYLQGKAKGDINFVAAICEIFNITVDDLLNTNYLPPLTIIKSQDKYLVKYEVSMVAEKKSPLYQKSKKSKAS